MKRPCYLCGLEAIERDHLPPRNLFKKPHPSDLITRPICAACHRPTHDDDEALRAFVSACITGNEKGKALWREKVVPRTLGRRRIKDFVAGMRQRLQPVTLKIGDQEVPVMQTGVDGRPIERVVTRMTRGFYSLFQSEGNLETYVDTTSFVFKVNPIDPFDLHDGRMLIARTHLKHFARGDGVYDCWWGLAEDDNTHGLWIHLFFNSSALVVRH